MYLTESFHVLLLHFQPVFTTPSFATFQSLMTGWIVSVRRRFVTDLIVSSNSTDNGHFSDYHRFFSHASWNIDNLWKILARLIVKTLVGLEGVIYLAGDDTLCRKRGLGIFGTGMHHDPLSSSKRLKIFHWGHNWVDLCIIIANPWWAPTKVFALPICMRLYLNRQGLTKGKNKTQSRTKAKMANGTSKKSKRATAAKQKAKAKQKAIHQKSEKAHKTRPELMTEMVAMVASWFPDRKFLLLVDSLYSGKSVLSKLPPNVDMIGPVHPKAALYELAPKDQPNRRGPRLKKGKRLPDLETWKKDRSKWQNVHFDQFGLRSSLRIKSRTGLYYKAGNDRKLRFVLSDDPVGDRPSRIFYCTDLSLKPRQILSLFSMRWSIEVTHYNCKQHLGLQDPANRTQKAVERTAPMSMFLYSLTIVWFATAGHQYLEFPYRPWYPHKSQPSFADMLTTLRRKTWDEQFPKVSRASAPNNSSIEMLKCFLSLAG